MTDIDLIKADIATDHNDCIVNVGERTVKLSDGRSAYWVEVLIHFLDCECNSERCICDRLPLCQGGCGDGDHYQLVEDGYWAVIDGGVVCTFASLDELAAEHSLVVLDTEGCEPGYHWAWFTSWRCNCTILAPLRGDVPATCPTHGEYMLIGGVEAIQIRDCIPFGLETPDEVSQRWAEHDAKGCVHA